MYYYGFIIRYNGGGHFGPGNTEFINMKTNTTRGLMGERPSNTLGLLILPHPMLCTACHLCSNVCFQLQEHKKSHCKIVFSECFMPKLSLNVMVDTIHHSKAIIYGNNVMNKCTLCVMLCNGLNNLEIRMHFCVKCTCLQYIHKSFPASALFRKVF